MAFYSLRNCFINHTLNKLREQGFVEYKRNYPLPVNISKLKSSLTGD